MDAAKQQAGEQLDAAKAEAAKVKSQIDSVKAGAEAEAANVKSQVTRAKVAAEAKVAEVQGQYDALHDDVDKKLATEVKPVIVSVITSYLLSLLQIGLVFLLTSPKVKAWVMNKLITVVKEEANRRLRATGVPDTLHEVLVVRMGRIKAKLYKVFTVVGKIRKLFERLHGLRGVGSVDEAAEKISGVGEKVAQKASAKAEKVSGKISNFMGGGRFGRK